MACMPHRGELALTVEYNLMSTDIYHATLPHFSDDQSCFLLNPCPGHLAAFTADGDAVILVKDRAVRQL